MPSSSCGARAARSAGAKAAITGITRSRAAASPDCPPEPVWRRGSALHPLYVGLHGQAEGRAAHERRLSALRLAHASLRVRLPRRRHVLVRGRRRLGHGPQLHRLRAARQRRDDPHVRRRAELSGREPLLASRRQAPGEHSLHGADRDPRAHARGRSAREALLAQEPAPARHGRRADQPRGLGVVLPRGRRRALPDRRHLVADGDGRHPDHAAAGRHGAEARLRDAAVLRHASRRSSIKTATFSTAKRSAIS